MSVFCCVCFLLCPLLVVSIFYCLSQLSCICFLLCPIAHIHFLLYPFVTVSVLFCAHLAFTLDYSFNSLILLFFKICLRLFEPTPNIQLGSFLLYKSNISSNLNKPIYACIILAARDCNCDCICNYDFASNNQKATAIVSYKYNGN